MEHDSNSRSDNNKIDPEFDFEKSGIGIAKSDILNDAKMHLKSFEPIKHNEILQRLLDQIKPVDFRELAGSTGEEKLQGKHFLVISIEQILLVARQNNWGICTFQDFVYLYNGAYWNVLEQKELQTFLGDAAEKLGVEKISSRVYFFREQLYKQFLAVANMPTPEQQNKVLINLKNGTFEISPEQQVLRPPQQKDFLKYQLHFEFTPTAKATLFETFLNRVQPDKKRQMILAEYLGYLFIDPSTLKLEKTLLLFGGGANGKSVFFEIVNALLGGNENVSSYSLQSLTDGTGYYRAMLANKLVNYASEINGKLEVSIFKQLVSGEPVEARLPYGTPFVLTKYAKLIFNCNELPKDVEQTHAFFRRLLIIPFEITIPEKEQDRQLSAKIIKSELSGVFNWVLEGLKRLLAQNNFTDSESVNNQIEQYKLQSDSVKQFLHDEGYTKSIDQFIPLKDLFKQYRSYCYDNGYHACSLRTVSERLKNNEYTMERKNYGWVVFAQKESVH